MPSINKHDWAGLTGPGFLHRPVHRLWLIDEARALFDFFKPNLLNQKGGFHGVDGQGTPLSTAAEYGEIRLLHATSRVVHCFAIGHLLGLPGMDRFVDHGMNFLWNRHRDTKHGGYFWGVDDIGAPGSTKKAYGHAFVLLAAASAKVVGHPDADRLLADVTDVLHSRFWDSNVGATTEEYAADWQPLSAYRGQNSNMHLTEALMAAFEVTNDQTYLDMADSIAHLIIDQHARAEQWRVPEHFDILWNVDRRYRGDPVFRPQGTTPGHALEWSRLLVQLWELSGRKHAWMLPAAEALFLNACTWAWDRQLGGFYYTLDWNNKPDQTDRYWWPCAEGLAAASALLKVSSDPQFELWYRRIWGFVDAHFIDRRSGGWFAELDASLTPVERIFEGKQDLYHALQACLIPLLPANGSVTRHLSRPNANDLLTVGADVKGN